MGKPFVLPFRHQNRFYIYDVNSNAILDVDERLFAHIGDVQLSHNEGSVTASIDSTSAAHSESDASEVCSSVRRYYAEYGLFSDRRPSVVKFPFSLSDLDVLLHTGVRHIVLNVTENCNLRCFYCRYNGPYTKGPVVGGRDMAPTTAEQAVRFLVDHATGILELPEERLTVGFYGGEPLLNFEAIRRCVEYVHKAYPQWADRFNFAITTNFTTPDRKQLQFLADHSFNLMVSLDGPQDVHDLQRVTRGGRGTFRTVTANLELLASMAPEYYRAHVAFSVVLTPATDLPRLANFLQTNEFVRHAHVLRCSPADGDETLFYEHFPDLLNLQAARSIELESLQRHFLQAIEHEADAATDNPELRSLYALCGPGLHRLFRRNCTRMGRIAFPNGICAPGFHRTFVASDGTLSPCEKVGGALPIGHLDTGFDMTAIERLIAEYVANCCTECLTCWAQRFCKLCFRAMWDGSHLNADRKRAKCSGTQRQALASMKQFCEVMQEPTLAQATKQYFDRFDTSDSYELAFALLRRAGRRAACGLEAGSTLASEAIGPKS